MISLFLNPYKGGLLLTNMFRDVIKAQVLLRALHTGHASLEDMQKQRSLSQVPTLAGC